MKSERNLAKSFHRESQFEGLLQEETNYNAVSVGLARSAQEFILSPFYIRQYDQEMYANNYRDQRIAMQFGGGGLSSLPPSWGGPS